MPTMYPKICSKNRPLKLLIYICIRSEKNISSKRLYRLIKNQRRISLTKKKIGPIFKIRSSIWRQTAVWKFIRNFIKNSRTSRKRIRGFLIKPRVKKKGTKIKISWIIVSYRKTIKKYANSSVKWIKRRLNFGIWDKI